MKRRMQIGVMLALGLLLAFNLWSFAQPGEPSGFIVSDLQLISTASRPDWGDHWTAPVEAATILAWFHDHGYPRLLEDLNNDGVIDELDTIELADTLGKGSMETDSPYGTTDALLVFGLASYVLPRSTRMSLSSRSTIPGSRLSTNENSALCSHQM